MSTPALYFADAEVRTRADAVKLAAGVVRRTMTVGAVEVTATDANDLLAVADFIATGEVYFDCEEHDGDDD